MRLQSLAHRPSHCYVSPPAPRPAASHTPAQSPPCAPASTMSSQHDLEPLIPMHGKPDGYLNPRRPTLRQRLRLYIGGALFICVGGYIIWKATLLLLGLFAATSSARSWTGWPQVKHLVVLYVCLSSA